MADSPVDDSSLPETADNDFSIDLILGLKVVNISCREDRLAKAISHLNQTLDDGLELIHILNLLFGNEGGIDGWRHHLNKVIILGHFDCRVNSLRDDCVKDLSFRTSRSQDQAFPVGIQNCPGNPRNALKILSIGKRDQFEHIFQAGLVLDIDGRVFDPCLFIGIWTN